ncbi:MAG: hypothetical protein ACR2LL_05945 [Nitrosopumilus sp.]|uniref:hypothetical protein n=1 Tax=Nitrosopumilus sp. TaxID=2024843 RepID=UPI00292E1D24|nr:hypothetical protein [Nitrosopumilus sp.]
MDKEERKFCPRCALENIKTKLKLIPNGVLNCERCKWLGKEVNNKLAEPFTCPRCTLEGIKSELKNYPNHILVCRKCQFVGRQVGNILIQTLF